MRTRIIGCLLLQVAIFTLVTGFVVFVIGWLVEMIFSVREVAWTAAKIGAGVGAAFAVIFMLLQSLRPAGEPTPVRDEDWPEDPEP